MTDINELVRCITALLALNERNVLVPHGVPGLARDCLKSASAALERMRGDAKQLETENSKFFEWAMAAKMRTQDAEAEVARLREALKIIANGRGKCSICGKMAEGGGAGYVACEGESRCTWVPNDPVDIARVALAQGEK